MSTTTITRPAPAALRPSRPAARPVARVAAGPARVRRRAHLTRRGRLVVVSGLVLLLFAAFSLGRAGAEGATSDAPGARLEQTVVQPGETLWGVAKRIAPGQDPRPVVDQIRELNDLSTSSLQVGQQLLLPVAG